MSWQPICLAGDLIHFCCQRDIAFGDTARIVGRQVDDDRGVDVEPLRVVVHGFSDERGAGHEAERLIKIGKLKFPVELIVFDRPAGQLIQRRGDLFSGEFCGL